MIGTSCTWRHAIAWLVVLTVAAPVLAADAPAPAAPAAAPTTKPSGPYAQAIPGTTVTIDMVPIPGGEFTPATGAAVKIKPLFMSKCEIVWDAYDIFAFQMDMTDQQKAAGVDAKSRPSRPYGDQTHGFGRSKHPAIHITRHAAEQYCVWLNKKTGKTYRLPTEAEWEYACRAGSTTTPQASGLDAVAWYWDNAEDKTHPVGKKSPNGWGLHDMLGNVMEYVIIPGAAADAKPTAAGGSYADEAKDVHCGARKSQTADWNSTDPQNPKSKWWL
ncbi:MAG: hypothetical protein QOF78_186, partial [Phycisphaerales bacterium]|nr:hypothetical protein [Phycisphaerales bacterium]